MGMGRGKNKLDRSRLDARTLTNHVVQPGPYFKVDMSHQYRRLEYFNDLYTDRAAK